MKKILLILMLIFSVSIFAVTLQDLDGKKVKYEDIVKNTEVAIVEYAAIWCPDCQKGFPDLDEFAKNKENVKVIIIFTEAKMKEHGFKKGLEDIKKYLKDNKYENFYIYYDYKGELIKKENIKYIPVQTIIFDGKAIKKYEDAYSKEDLNYIFRKY